MTVPERSRLKRSAIALGGVLLALLSLCTCPAQDDDEVLVGGVPLENAVLARDLVFRFRAEAQFTEDDDELIEDDVAYVRFPSRMYSSEIKAFRYDRFSSGLSYSRWQNEQDLDLQHWSWDARIPLGSAKTVDLTSVDAGAVPPSLPSLLTLRYRRREFADGQSVSARHQAFAGIGKSLPGKVYSYTQYRIASVEDDIEGHQLSEYVSWACSSRGRIGGQLAVSEDEGEGGVRPWYVRAFGTFFIVQDLTAVRLEASVHEPDSDLRYQQYDSCLYQKIGSRTFARLSFRHYRDSEEVSSNAWGIKVKRFFTPRMSAHIGYRYYDHSATANFDTFLAGLGVLL